MILKENQLDIWVRGNAQIAQGRVVELVWRLVAAACPGPKERRFPLADSVGQPGPDGVLDTDTPCPPFVPPGKSYWQIGTGTRPGKKATDDYKALTKSVPATERSLSSFVFVTPLSASSGWPHTWAKKAQRSWLQTRKKRGEWKDVHVIDGTILIDWMHQFPSVELWMAGVMGVAVEHIETPEQRWDLIRTYGEPPPLTPHVFLASRSAVVPNLEEVFNGSRFRLKLASHFRGQVADFVCAWLQTLDPQKRIEYSGKCLVISRMGFERVVSTLPQPHILVANVHLEDLADEGAELVQRARKHGHALIFGGMPGGIPDPNGISLPNPKDYHIREALKQAGYPEERARTLGQRCGGRLPSLLRLLQNLADLPEWAQRSDTAELAIAQFLGGWNEQSVDDRTAVEGLAGKAYGEWIGTLRKVAMNPDTPLIQYSGTWRVVARYEVWHTLGPRVADTHLDRFRTMCTAVLGELDPQFELAPNDRFAAGLHGKVLKHSRALRHGLAVTLALLGNYPKALTSCSHGRAAATARLCVRDVLQDADWLRWASLNDLLPLLAEAAPGEFLDAVDKALATDPSPLDRVFQQEGSGVFGWNYMTGLLWALESLAWEEEYLTRVAVLLGDLARRDPGGNWANRPCNSLTTILLPWFPQTCASLKMRIVAVQTLLEEQPDIAWKFLLSILPSGNQSTMGTRKPAWRPSIPEDLQSGASMQEYIEQVQRYADIALSIVKADGEKLVDLIERYPDLPETAGQPFLEYLESTEVVGLPEGNRVRIWNELLGLIAKHRRFPDAPWAMSSERLVRLSVAADRLAPRSPFYKHQWLFTDRDHDLLEEKGNYREQLMQLEERRAGAIGQVFAEGGMAEILRFAATVESSWKAGFAFGTGAPEAATTEILPQLLDSSERSLALFAGGFVKGRFAAKKWEWVDNVAMQQWTKEQIGQVLAYLPFCRKTWDRATRLLGADESAYWTRTGANAHETDGSVEHAVDQLTKYGRPFAAIACLSVSLYNRWEFVWQQAVRVLNAALQSPESANTLDAHAVTEVIKDLQHRPDVEPGEVERVEWGYLGLLGGHLGVEPVFLERRLAQDPDFFSELIRATFRSEHEPDGEVQVDEGAREVARNAYRLLEQWKRPPGTKADGTIDAPVLHDWLARARARCEQSDHLNIALQRIGHVLAHAPADSDGLWIDSNVAKVLNAKDVDEMRLGFRIELFNSRGARIFTSGQEESNLAASCRDRAQQLDERGLFRLAETMRDLGKEYEHMAERWANVESLEDLQ